VWQDILKELPPDADREAVMHDVEAAVVRFQREISPETRQASAEQAERWKRVGEILQQVAFAKLREVTRNLDPANPDAQWVQRLCEELPQLQEKAADWAEFYRPPTKRERLYSEILTAWTGPGKVQQLSISSAGPLTRFFCAIVDQVLSEPLSGETVRDIVERELDRRSKHMLLAQATVGFQLAKNGIMVIRSSESSPSPGEGSLYLNFDY
jgi:hypothetical protein